MVLRLMPDNLVDCVVTSPPYWGLRDYGIEGQIGLEQTPQEYILKILEIFREVRRILKPEGTTWLNLGDNYATGAGKVGECPGGGPQGEAWKKTFGKSTPGSVPSMNGIIQPNRMPLEGLKPKDLVGIPWRVALALQADGWWLRSDIIWSKPNPMPESVADRPTKSHEYLFLLTKNKKYFFDQETVKEPATDKGRINGRDGRIEEPGAHPPGSNPRTLKRLDYSRRGRNIRSVWNISTQAFPGAHFATFPEALVEPCIKAGTSGRGYCPKCGKPWKRVVEKTGGTTGKSWVPHKEELTKGMSEKNSSLMQRSWENGAYQVNTVGWSPSCQCGKEPIPGVVLDPFIGSGTVAAVAYRLGRDYLGIELNPNYIAMSQKRLAMTPAQKELF
jgi:DNA modification methylase